MQKTGAIPDARELRPELSSRAALVIRQSLSFQAADRHATPIEFCRALSIALLDPRPAPVRQTRRAFIAGLAAPVAGAAGFLWYRDWSAAPAAIEYRGGQPEEGLVKHRDIEYLAEYNAARTAYDLSRLVTRSQGDYRWTISGGGQRTTLRRGWRLTVEGEAKRGLLYAEIVFPAAIRRWDLCLRPDKRGGQTVFLCTRIIGGIEGLEYEVPGPPEAPHVYTLVAGPNAASAALLVDGKECLTGYTGHSDYLDHGGFILGVSSYLSTNGGEGWVRRARFEVA
jgi:hypothetical protein